MAKYAERTNVSPEQRRGEIERTLARYGATAFGYATSGSHAQVVFELGGRRMRLDVPLPDPADRKYTMRTDRPWQKRTDSEAARRWEQDVRQRWAALSLWIKAQCEAIDSEVVTAEQAFLGWVVLPDGKTLAEKVAPSLETAYASGEMPALMPGGTQ
jgi:hypothetical protein